MSQQEVLKRIIQALESAGIPYMLTGSLVSSFQGEPRSTHDIDFDAIRVYELQFPTLDREYLDRWVSALKVEELWQELLARAVPLE